MSQTDGSNGGIDASPGKDRPRAARRSLWAFGALALGMMLAEHARWIEPSVWAGAALGCLCIGAVSRRWLCLGALLTACGLLGGLWFTVCLLQAPGDSLALWLGDDADAEGHGRLVTLTGIVIDPPAEDNAPSPVDLWRTPGAGGWRGSNSARMVVEASRIGPISANPEDGTPVSGRVWVTLGGGKPDVTVSAGDLVRISGVLRPVRGARNPGQRDTRLWAAQDGMVASLVSPGTGLVAVVGDGSILGDGPAARAGAAAWRWLAGLRSFAGAALGAPLQSGDTGGPMSDGLRAQGRALLAALLIGRYEPDVRPMAEAFFRLGLVHALSISGFHVSVMAAVMLFVVRRTGHHRWLEPVLVAALVVLYLLVVPASAPLVRSALMVLAFLAAEATGRRYDRLNLLGWIACAVLLWRPLDLWSPGFVLSFGVTGALLWIGKPLAERMISGGAGQGDQIQGLVRQRVPLLRIAWEALRSWCIALVSSCVLAWAVSTPLVAMRMGVVSWMGVPASVVMIPAITVALWVGYITLLLGAASQLLGMPWIASGAGNVLDYIGVMLVRLTDLLDAAPGAVSMVPQVGAVWAAAATSVVLLWLVRLARGQAIGVWTRCSAVVVLLWLVALVGVPSIYSGGSQLGAGLVRIDTLSIVGGRCELVRCQGQAVLVNAGSASAGEARGIAREVTSAVRELGGWHVRTLLLQAPSAECCAAAADLVPMLGVTDVLTPPGFLELAERAPTSGAAGVVAALRRRGVTVRALGPEEAIKIGACSVYFGTTGADGQGKAAARAYGHTIELGVDPGERARWVELDPDGRQRSGVWMETGGKR